MQLIGIQETTDCCRQRLTHAPTTWMSSTVLTSSSPVRRASARLRPTRQAPTRTPDPLTRRTSRGPFLLQGCRCPPCIPLLAHQRTDDYYRQCLHCSWSQPALLAVGAAADILCRCSLLDPLDSVCKKCDAGTWWAFAVSAVEQVRSWMLVTCLRNASVALQISSILSVMALFLFFWIYGVPH